MIALRAVDSNPPPGLLDESCGVYAGPPCPQFFKHSIIFREPLDRIISQMTFTHHTAAHVQFWLSHSSFAPPILSSQEQRSIEHFEKLAQLFRPREVGSLVLRVFLRQCH